MSKSEVERFAADLRSDDSLRQEVDRITTNPLATVVGIAQRRGYGFTLDEAKDFVRAKAHAAGKPLSDGELDHVAGGTNPIEAIGNAGKSIGSGLESAGKAILNLF